MNNRLDAILDACVNDLEDGKVTVAECLARYPEHAASLEPLLRAATLLTGGRKVLPSPAYRARARSQLNTYMVQNPQRRRLSPVFWRFAIGLATVFLLFVASGTTFAQGALPGDTLYNWKLTSENVWRMTARDQVGVDLALSNRRVNELLIVSGDPTRWAQAVQGYERLVIQFSAQTDERQRERIVPVLRSQHEVLNKAGISVPALEKYFPE
jgi:hypothetical protein